MQVGVLAPPGVMPFPKAEESLLLRVLVNLCQPTVTLQFFNVFHRFFHIFSSGFWDPAALLGWTSASFQLPRRQHQLRAELPHQQLRRLPRLLPLMLSKIDRHLGPGEKGGDGDGHHLAARIDLHGFSKAQTFD